MPVPRRRATRSRRAKRRTHWKARPPAVTQCSHCSRVKPPHAVCPHCGHYAGRVVVEREEE